jgi:hypothetical protein
MTGIQYLTDEKGNTTAVQIDIRKRPEIWEDIQDAIESKERLKGPFEPIEELHARLLKKSKAASRPTVAKRSTTSSRMRNVSR